MVVMGAAPAVMMAQPLEGLSHHTRNHKRLIYYCHHRLSSQDQHIHKKTNHIILHPKNDNWVGEGLLVYETVRLVIVVNYKNGPISSLLPDTLLWPWNLACPPGQGILPHIPSSTV